jgi:3-hydroxymyristoyl/3-hydroxydecanoyl-(acyl carrier protein) dehydratase
MRNADSPAVLDKRVAEHSAELRLFVGGQLSCFRGHFPDAPIVPGVMQIHWAIEFARQLLDMDIDASAIEALKFQRAIPPATYVTLKLQFATDTKTLYFDYSSEAGRFSSGRIAMR